uniref:Uncharacterized protein n=1 Tax=Caenorhabditis japonica TaxID=281687 RepID=A0A8R1EQL6_CAEJA
IFLFGYCKITEQGYLYESPDDLMMIEFAEDVTYSQYLQPACFSRNMEDHDPDVSLSFYSYDFKSNNVEKKRVKVVNERKKGTVKRQGDSLVLTTSGVTGCSNFKDGLVARRIDGKLMIVGALIQNSFLREPADYDAYTNDKKTEEVETHPPPAQVDVTDLPAKAIVRMMELPAHMITSEVHPFASSHVEPIKKMDPPDSAAKRISYYCTLDMIQAGRNKSITDARIINETRPMLKPIRRENLRTIDFWPNHADGALPEHRTRDGA